MFLAPPTYKGNLFSDRNGKIVIINGRISFRLEDMSQYRILTVERTFPLNTRVGIVHENGKLNSSLPLPTLLPTDLFYLLKYLLARSQRAFPFL